jgi:hypothetical protein
LQERSDCGAEGVPRSANHGDARRGTTSSYGWQAIRLRSPEASEKAEATPKRTPQGAKAGGPVAASDGARSKEADLREKNGSVMRESEAGKSFRFRRERVDFGTAIAILSGY